MDLAIHREQAGLDDNLSNSFALSLSGNHCASGAEPERSDEGTVGKTAHKQEGRVRLHESELLAKWLRVEDAASGENSATEGG